MMQPPGGSDSLFLPLLSLFLSVTQASHSYNSPVSNKNISSHAHNQKNQYCCENFKIVRCFVQMHFVESVSLDRF